MNCKFTFLLVVCFAVVEPAWCAHKLNPEEWRFLKRWLIVHTDYRLATDADCECSADIAAMRTQSAGVWKPVPDYHPYTATGDFNGDGVEDFAVVVIVLPPAKTRHLH